MSDMEKMSNFNLPVNYRETGNIFKFWNIQR